jgi:muramoyltetrapeptide carboxypeptidase
LSNLIEKFEVSCRYFCGFSDITSLLFGLQQQVEGVQAVHAPNLATAQFCDDSPQAHANRLRLHALLFGATTPVYEQQIQVIAPGVATGPIVGGCLSVFVGLLGTPFQPNLQGKILFLEDVAEKPYRIDRMLMQLQLSGVLQGIKGLVFGEMLQCDDDTHQLGDIIADVLAESDFPVVMGVHAGHAPVNMAFMFNQQARIDTFESSFYLL